VFFRFSNQRANAAPAQTASIELRTGCCLGVCGYAVWVIESKIPLAIAREEVRDDGSMLLDRHSCLLRCAVGRPSFRQIWSCAVRGHRGAM
jgi:NADH:ubiquinone oxidoreductase subunit E